ncbi:hypothetical protein FN846DRAFT_919925 [Sphaerosporella brunnea]|uniref:Uncharacterized protein n=1 Tax=Sphaerosporella brunnea TaxID=1250544 RepID=A0A5J5EVA3_9PEZI|nr:hypothetical protein FN846DRAFT_919925 [Sphaerosporella brunnea]
MTRPSKRTIISRQATAIHKRRRLAEAEAEAESQQIAEPVVPDEVENEGEVKEDDEAEEDDGDREAMHKSLQTYINTLQVHNGADSDSERQTRQQAWPRVPRSKRVEILKAALSDMKKLLLSARKCPAGQDYTRHLQVKAFICVQLAHTGLGGRCAKTRTELSLQVAQHSLKKSYVAKGIRLHETSWITKRVIPEGAQGRHAKTPCMLEDEGTLMAFEEYMTGEGKLATGPGLANAITEYWRSEGITNEDGSEAKLADRTATEWMNRKGYK